MLKPGAGIEQWNWTLALLKIKRTLAQTPLNAHVSGWQGIFQGCVKHVHLVIFKNK